MRVIFLDFDGVLNNQAFMDGCKDDVKKYMTTFDDNCLQALRKILDAVPDAAIVVSSSWRNMYTPEQLEELLKNNNIDPNKFIGVTGQVGFSGHRGREISGYLKDNPEISQYVVIDDDIFDLGAHKANLVHTTFTSGLTSDLADQAIQILQAK